MGEQDVFREQTLFVVGAGASTDFGLPIGRKLADTIAQKLFFSFESGGGNLIKGDREIYDRLTRRYPDIDERNVRLTAARHISEGIFLTGSIDNFIDMHRSIPAVAEVGKLAIAIAISEAEADCFMRVSDRNIYNKIDLRSPSAVWTESLARLLFEKVKDAELDRIGENVSIICFNYDRCIEQYMIAAIEQTYRVSYERARAVVYKMQIIHPYGSLGDLPAKSLFDDSGAQLRFGKTIQNGLDPWPVAERIKTYTEQVEDEAMLARMNAAVDGAAKIVFLGFGFHPQNMELLKSTSRTGQKTVYSTGVGVARQEVDEVCSRIVGIYAGKPAWAESVHIEEDCNNTDLFRRHWRNLSAA